jgi:hypothetical protein
MNKKLIAAALIGIGLSAAHVASAAPAAAPNTAVLSTMTVDGPDHRLYRFEYVAGQGWKFAGSAAAPKVRLASNGELTPVLAAGIGAGILEPQTVFADAATGYRFVWGAAHGWTFAGQAAD